MADSPRVEADFGSGKIQEEILKPFRWVGLRDWRNRFKRRGGRADRKPVAGLVNAGSRRGTAGGPAGRRSGCPAWPTRPNDDRPSTFAATGGSAPHVCHRLTRPRRWDTHGRPVRRERVNDLDNRATGTDRDDWRACAVRGADAERRSAHAGRRVRLGARGRDVSDPGTHTKLGTRPGRSSAARDARSSLRSRFESSRASRVTSVSEVRSVGHADVLPDGPRRRRGQREQLSGRQDAASVLRHRVQVYIDERDDAIVDEEVVRDVIATFDQHVFPHAYRTIGLARDVDGDGRFTVLLSSWLRRLGGGRHAVDGFVRADLDHRLPAPFSNHCDMMYLSSALQAGPHLRTVIAHEYTHAVTFTAKARAAASLAAISGRGNASEEEGWLDEALAHLGRGPARLLPIEP